MINLSIKPLSVNIAWEGQRFKTNEYKAFEQHLNLILPRRIDIPKGELFVIYEFGVSNKGFDWDNGIKQFQDVLSKKYGFNDNRIIDAYVKKRIVSKGKEYIKFKILSGNCVFLEIKNKDYKDEENET